MASGCNAILGIDDLSLRADAATDTPTPEHCYGTLAKGCFPVVPSGSLTLTGNLDTGSDSRCSMGPFCAIGADTLTVDMLTVSGTRPLVLVALTTLTITNRLEAGSTLARLGPGANSPDCGQPGAGGLGGTSGGGAGGSFSSLGAAGGNGSAGGTGGTPAAIQTPTALRGGCRGGGGGGANLGAGGNGGGAVALYAGVKIQINEDVRVSGAGGGAAQNGNAGGGGGGSGGMVILEAMAIDVANDVFANGGGGGEGASTTGAGNVGVESTAYDNAANGGSGGSGGGDGGDGFALAIAAKPGSTPGGGGGGGGGGGAGVIWVKGTVTGTKISPAAIQR